MGRESFPDPNEPLSRAFDRFRYARERGRLSSSLIGEIVDLLDQLPPEEVPWADRWVAVMAGLHQWRPLRWWARLTQRDGPSTSVTEQPELAFVYLFHSDGYERETALNHLSSIRSPFFLAALAWRMNDWAPPVRDAARRASERLLPSAPASVVVPAAPFLLDRRHRWQRWEEESARFIDLLFSRSDVADGLVEDLLTRTTGRLPTLLRDILRRPVIDGRLLELFREAAQPGVRATALKALLRGRASWAVGFEKVWIDRRYGIHRRRTVLAHRPIEHAHDVCELVRLGLRDPSPVVRRALATVLVERRRELPYFADAIASLKADTSPGVRQRAEFLERKKAEEDVLG